MNILQDSLYLPTLGGYPLASFSSALTLDGTAGAYVSAPDDDALDITGDIDIRIWAELDWDPPSTFWLLNKDVIATGERGPSVFLTTAAELKFDWSADGTAMESRAATVALANTTVLRWVRVTLDVDNGAGGNDTTFYTSDDGVTWSQLGDTVTEAGTTSLNTNAGPLEIGRRANASGYTTGSIRRVLIYDATTLVADPRFDTAAPGSATVTDAERTYTLNGTASIDTY